MDINIKNLIETEEDDKDLFISKIDSKLQIDMSKNQILDDDEWIDMTIFTIPHIIKALNKWNKYIVTEEEIIKMELIKKVSIESIKHLAKHTNYVTKFDEETGEVIPEKILNAFKEESFITYENRFLYTLIGLIDDFIYLRTRELR